MNRKVIICLLILSLSLTGCTWTRTDPVLTVVDILGEPVEGRELWILGENSTYLVELGSDALFSLPLAPGIWKLQAAARDAIGNVVALSETGTASGGRQVLSLTLDKTLVPTTEVQAGKVLHSLLLGGVELAWQAAEVTSHQGGGRWEIWRRPREGRIWEKIGETAPTETNYFMAGLDAFRHVYAVRWAPSGKDKLPGPLQISTGAASGVLEIEWDFEHTFPPVERSYLRAQSLAGETPQPAYYDLIAHFKTEEAFALREEILSSLGLRLKEEICSLAAAVVEPEPDSALSLEELSTYHDQNVFLEPNWILQASAQGNLLSNLPWYLDYLRIPAAHTVTWGDQAIRIAVLDSGLDEYRLPASVKVLPGYNFVQKNFNTADDFGHGTNVALTISEVMPVVSLLPVKVLNAQGGGFASDVSQGMLYAAGLHDSLHNPYPCQIINLSLGASSILLQKAVRQITANTDVILLSAAGNTKAGATEPGLFYPAAFSEVIAVGAIEPGPEGPERAYYSHFGPNLDLVAPPSFEDGTSFAVALVSGVAGLMLAEGISPEDIRPTLTATAIDLGLPGWDEEYGHGLVNAEWAVKGITELTLILSDHREGSLERKMPLEADAQSLDLPPGEYKVQAWVNVQGGVEPEKGDYYASADAVVLENGRAKVRLTLPELKE